MIAIGGFWVAAGPTSLLRRHVMINYREGSFGFVHAGIPLPEGLNATSIFSEGNGTPCEFVEVPDASLYSWFSHPALNGHHWPETQVLTHAPSSRTYDLGAALSWCCAQGLDCGGVELYKTYNDNGIGLNLSVPASHESVPSCRPHRIYSANTNKNSRYIAHHQGEIKSDKRAIAYAKRRCSFDTIAHAHFWAWYCLVGVLVWFGLSITSLGRAIRLRGVRLPWCKRIQTPAKTFYWKVIFEKDSIAAHKWCFAFVLATAAFGFYLGWQFASKDFALNNSGFRDDRLTWAGICAVATGCLMLYLAYTLHVQLRDTAHIMFVVVLCSMSVTCFLVAAGCKKKGCSGYIGGYLKYPYHGEFFPGSNAVIVASGMLCLLTAWFVWRTLQLRRKLADKMIAGDKKKYNAIWEDLVGRNKQAIDVLAAEEKIIMEQAVHGALDSDVVARDSDNCSTCAWMKIQIKEGAKYIKQKFDCRRHSNSDIDDANMSDDNNVYEDAVQDGDDDLLLPYDDQRHLTHQNQKLIREAMGNAAGEPTRPMQLMNNLSVLFAQAAMLNGHFQAAVNRWAGVSGTAKGSISVKRRRRAIEKLFRCYGGDGARIIDLVRSVIEFETIEDLTKCLNDIANDPKVGIINVKNRLAVSYNSDASAGYRNVALNLILVDAFTMQCQIDTHVCELQLGLAVFEQEKDADGHKRYVEWRNARAD